MMERYEIGCKTCGVITHENTSKRAFAYAQFYASHGHKDCGDISIYDRMAHYGRPDMWSAAGSLLHVKEERPHGR